MSRLVTFVSHDIWLMNDQQKYFGIEANCDEKKILRWSWTWGVGLISAPQLYSNYFPLIFAIRVLWRGGWCDYSVRQRYHCNEFPNIGPALAATLARFALYTGGERVLLHKSWIAQKRFIRSSIVEWSFKITPSVVHFFKICVLQFIFDCNIRDTHCTLVVFVSIQRGNSKNGFCFFD